MTEYISYKNYLKNSKKNKIALSYAIQKNINNNAVLNLINNVLKEKNSFVFESVEKALYRGRYTIIGLDPDKKWEIKGNYVYVNNKKTLNKNPRKGLSVARMAGHISYLSEKGLQEKFGRKLQQKGDFKFTFDADFQVESYLKYQGNAFVDRFDANSYLYLTRAIKWWLAVGSWRIS